MAQPAPGAPGPDPAGAVLAEREGGAEAEPEGRAVVVEWLDCLEARLAAGEIQ